MKISVVSFTEQGRSLAEKFREQFTDREVLLSHKPEEGVSRWAGQQFFEGNALVFIGASGIAVRAIAPFVKDKLTDSPVLVLDERGRYVIPLLSGHMGGANDLAVCIAKRLGQNRSSRQPRISTERSRWISLPKKMPCASGTGKGSPRCLQRSCKERP